MILDDLVGKEFLFYGVDTHCFKLDDTVWEAIEDPDDGYRSMLGEVQQVPNSNGIFFRAPIALVELETSKNTDQSGYVLTDVEDGHVWLVFGTDNQDDYYPYYYFLYTPKPPKLQQDKSNPSQPKNKLTDPLDRFFEPRES